MLALLYSHFLAYKKIPWALDKAGAEEAVTILSILFYFKLGENGRESEPSGTIKPYLATYLY
jgi:hypothetical protein